MTVKTQNTVKNLVLYIWGGGAMPLIPVAYGCWKEQCVLRTTAKKGHSPVTQ